MRENVTVMVDRYSEKRPIVRLDAQEGSRRILGLLRAFSMLSFEEVEGGPRVEPMTGILRVRAEKMSWIDSWKGAFSLISLHILKSLLAV